MSALVTLGRRMVAPAAAKAEDGFAAELRFWDEYLAARPPCVGSADIRARAFPPVLRACLDEIVPAAGAVPRVLELGSGPLSLLAGGVERGWLELTAIDPLAIPYARMMARHGAKHPVQPLAGRGESLFEVVQPRTFDIAYSGNAIDHASDPRACVANLARAVRVGGRLVLEGFCHEATNAGWEGLHQHDLVPERGELVHYDRARARRVLSEGLALRCLAQEVRPFSRTGLRWFGYEPESAGGGLCGWFEFDWYTLVFEVTG